MGETNAAEPCVFNNDS